jgi:hypothetical protein
VCVCVCTHVQSRRLKAKVAMSEDQKHDIHACMYIQYVNMYMYTHIHTCAESFTAAKVAMSEDQKWDTHACVYIQYVNMQLYIYIYIYIHTHTQIHVQSPSLRPK